MLILLALSCADPQLEAADSAADLYRGGRPVDDTGGSSAGGDTAPDDPSDDTGGSSAGGDTAPDDPSDAETQPFDLSDVTWLHTDVSGWAQTATLSSVTVSSDQICLNYDKASVWSIYDYDGTDVVANPWIFIWHDDQWYGATWEWMRPDQTCKSRSAVAGDHIKQAPFDAASGWTPTSGETYYFMVSGLARGSFRNHEERSGLVEVVWP